MDDFKTYKPGKAVLARLRTVHFVAVIGPTAAGKTTLIDALVSSDPMFHLVLSDITRLPHPGERPGIDYYLRDREYMMARAARQEYMNVAGGLNGADLYATPPESFPVSGVSIMPIFAEVIPELRALPFASFQSVFVLPPDLETWKTRLETRNFTPEQKTKRLAEAARSLQFALNDPSMLFIVNDNVATAAATCKALLQHEASSQVFEGQPRLRFLASQLLEGIPSL